MEILRIDQLTQEWFEAHLGRCTASHAKDLLRPDLKPYSDYLAKKAAEILTGKIGPDKPPTFEMQWGIEHEADARREYSLREGVFVEQIGFVIGDDERTGCSPDGFQGDKGIIQFKCPNTSTHMKWVIEGILPQEHLAQCRFELMVCRDRQWHQLVSFDPRLPKRYRMWKAPLLLREDAKIPEMAVMAGEFEENLDKLLRKMAELMPPVEDDEAPEPIGNEGITADDILWAQEHLG
jgi:hypothetical protein